MDDLFERFGQVDERNELWLKEKYDALMAAKTPDYCLVALTLKDFLRYSHLLGHEEGQRALRTCFELLAGCLVEGEHIIRIHSWHFALLVKCTPDETGLHPNAQRFHYAIRDGMEERYGRKLFLQMGYYPMTKPEVDFYLARYYSDISGSGFHSKYRETNYDMYYVSFLDGHEAFIKLEDKVSSALNNGDFKLYLQPKVDLRTGEVTAAEALMRWVDPRKGLIPLGDFLPGIEENGTVRDVDRYLFDKGCAYLEKWRKQYGKRVQLSFNMCRAYFNGSDFLPDYGETFRQYDVPAEDIRIELLESVVLNKLDRLEPLVAGIYDLGFSCALDDFGSGFSSFDVLTNVRLSELKIDRSLFQNIENEKERLLIRHIVEIAHSMGMVAVAEGVETQAYATYLKEIGCDFIQGFLYYRPMPVEEFEQRFILGH